MWDSKEWPKLVLPILVYTANFAISCLRKVVSNSYTVPFLEIAHSPRVRFCHIPVFFPSSTQTPCIHCHKSWSYVKLVSRGYLQRDPHTVLLIFCELMHPWGYIVTVNKNVVQNNITFPKGKGRFNFNVTSDFSCNWVALLLQRENYRHKKI